jgi:hypothetical protein
MFVSVVIPSGPRCLRCMFVIFSSPAAEEFLICCMTLLVSFVVARVAVGSSGNCCLRLMMRLSTLYLGNLLMFA